MNGQGMSHAEFAERRPALLSQLAALGHTTLFHRRGADRKGGRGVVCESAVSLRPLGVLAAVLEGNVDVVSPEKAAGADKCLRLCLPTHISDSLRERHHLLVCCASSIQTGAEPLDVTQILPRNH
jgi:hypothetical protein